VKVFPAILAFSVIPLLAQVPPPSAMPPKPAPARPTAAPAAPADPNKVVLTIGNEKITEAQYDDMINAIPAQYQAYARGPGKRAFAEQIVQVKVLSQEAEKKKLDQEPKIKDELTFQRQNLLAQAMFLQLQQSVKVDDAAIEKYYNEHKQDYEVLKGRHILIRAKGAPMQAAPGKPELSDEEALAKAKDIRAKIVAGGDFAALAKAESDDTGSGANGGDLGEFKKGMMVPPFEEAAFAAKVGEVTEPVKTPFGYHIIKIESHTTKSVAEAKPDIEKKLRPEIARKEVEDLRKGATVQLDDSFFGPAIATPGGVNPGVPPPPPPPSATK
jgi:parvulin-like peptidyl-prolyl isomerase